MKLADVADLQLDPLCPPKYCPQCAMRGVKTKVKKFKMGGSADKKMVIMCKNEKCPWPFSVRSPSEVTVKADVQIFSTPSGGDFLEKKRKHRETNKFSANKKARPNNFSKYPEEIFNERTDIKIDGDRRISNEDPATSEDAKDIRDISIEERTEHSVIVTKSGFSYVLDMLDFEPEAESEDLEYVISDSYGKNVELNIVEEENIDQTQTIFEPLNQNFFQDLQSPQSTKPKPPLSNLRDIPVFGDIVQSDQDMSGYDTNFPAITSSLVSPHKQMSPDQSHNSLASIPLQSPSDSIQQEDVSSPILYQSAPSSSLQSHPDDLISNSLYTDQTCSVIHITQSDPTSTTPQDAVGQGPKILKFFYRNPIEDTRMGFSPVRVTTEKQVKCVVALVAEKAEEYYRSTRTEDMKPMVYTTEAAMATYVLDKIVVIHIKRCFSKKGMAAPNPGRKKRMPKAGDIMNDDSGIAEEKVCSNKKGMACLKIGIKKRKLKIKDSLKDESISVEDKGCLNKKGKAESKPGKKEKFKIKDSVNCINQVIPVSENSCDKRGNFSKNLNDLSNKHKTEYKQLKKVKTVPKMPKVVKRGKGRPKKVQPSEANRLASQATANRILNQLSNHQVFPPHQKQELLSTDIKSSPGKPAKSCILEELPLELSCLSSPDTTSSDQLSLTESLDSQPSVASCSQETADQMSVPSLPSDSGNSTKVLSFIKYTSSLFDIDEDGEFVQAEIFGHHEPQVMNNSETELHYIGAFERRSKQFHTASSSILSSLSSKLCLKAGMTIEAEMLPQKSFTSLEFPSPDTEDDIATVMKLGTGVSVDRELSQIEDSEVTNIDCGISLKEKENSVVFHVANQTMTTQPSVLENIKVKDQGNTKVLLTSSSDQVQLEDLKKDCVQFNFRPDQRGGRGKPSSGSKGRVGGRGRERGLHPQLKGVISFYWKDWLVNIELIWGFSDYLLKLERKFNLPMKSKIDPRIQALLREKGTNTVKPETMQKVISFFSEVYVKYLYLNANFPTLDMKKVLSILKNHYILDNQPFAAHISLLMTEQQQDTTEIGNRDIYEEKHSSDLDTGDELSYNIGSSNTLIVNPSEDGFNNSLLSSPTDPPSPMLPTSVRQISKTTQSSSPQSEPDDIISGSLYTDQTCSVQLIQADSTATSKNVVGQGTKLIQFFYSNPGEETWMTFPPVRVSSEEEVNCVVALVTENAEEFTRRNTKKRFRKPMQYTTEAVLANSVLDKKIVSHIKRCFTKRGMTDLKLGRRKWSGLKRKDVIKIPSEKTAAVVKVDFVSDDEEIEELQEIEEFGLFEELKENHKVEENVEVLEELFEEPVEEESLEENVPTEEELKLEMEEKLFGGLLPKTVRRERPPRTGASDREGRGGRNEFAKKNVPESLKLGAVEYMLACKRIKDGGEQEPLPRPTISLSGLFRKRSTRRKRINIDFDDLSDDEDEDYKAPSVYNRKADRPDEENKRKSNRLNERQVRVDSGEYFDVGNYQFVEKQDNCSAFLNEEEYSQDTGHTEQTSSITRRSGSYVNENYLRRRMNYFGKFDHAFARKKHSKKIFKLLENKLRADTAVNKKYKGFGEMEDKVPVAGGKLIKKSKVSDEEANLMKELLATGEAAIAESSEFGNMITVDTEAIQEFDEDQL